MIANVIYDDIDLIVGGSLDGKYIYFSEVYPQFTYLKRYSSILGQPFLGPVPIKAYLLDYLDLNMFISPKGSLSVVKNTANTIYNGVQTIFA